MSGEMVSMLGKGPATFAVASADLCDELTEDNMLHGFWVYPMHAAVTVLSLAAQPILAAIAMVAAAAFKLVGCCWDESEEKATKLFKAVVCGFMARPQLWVRIFNPTFIVHYPVRRLDSEEAVQWEHFPIIPANIAALTGKLCKVFVDAKQAHALWTYPLNAIVTLLAVALQPIASVIGIVVAAIFRQLGSCSGTFYNLADTTFDGAISGLSALPELVVRIIDPSFYLDFEYDVENLTR